MKAYTHEAYTQQLLQLFPSGAAWSRDGESVLAALAAGLSQEPARIDIMAHNLLQECDPTQTLSLLPEWERMCGLPDACSHYGESITERRQAIELRLAAHGGQSRAYYEELASMLTGARCSVEEFLPFRAGTACAGDALYNGSWQYAFAIRAPSVPMRAFSVASSVVGEALRHWGHEHVECIIRHYKPAHTIVLFTYGA